MGDAPERAGRRRSAWLCMGEQWAEQSPVGVKRGPSSDGAAAGMLLQRETSIFSSQVSVCLCYHKGQDNGLHPTASEQQCREPEELRNSILSSVQSVSQALPGRRRRPRCHHPLLARMLTSDSLTRRSRGGRGSGSPAVHLRF